MIDAELADRIAARFELGANPVLSAAPVGNGEQGQIWRLDTDRSSWAVKEAFRGISPMQVRDAAAFSAAARAAGITTPLAIADQHGNYLADVGGVQVRVQEWVDLLPPDLRLDPVSVGRTLAAIHRARFNGAAPLDEWFTDPVRQQQWDSLAVLLADAGAPFAGQFAQMHEEWVALASWVVPPREVRACHRDLWADNLLPTPAGGVCVIDWDDSGLADPGFELACLLFEFGGGEADRIGAIYDSYRRRGGPGQVRRPGDFSMLICQLGHICEIACRDWLDPAARATDREHSAERFAEFVERPLDRAGLETILASVRG